MHRKTVALASGILLLAVVLGAFGAHAIKDLVDDTSAWQTAVSYQFYHGFALLFLAFVRDALTSTKFRQIRGLFLAGIILFSGSLYALQISYIIDVQSIRSVLGPITPIGGLCFISAWALLLLTSLKGEN